MTDYSRALAQGSLAYTIWGAFGLYFTLLADVPSVEVLAHRVVWCLVITVGLILLLGHKARFLSVLKQPRSLAWLTLSSILISFNWGIYIWAVAQAQVIEASLGYFLSPLIAVLLGRIFLGERLSTLQKVSVGFAAVGVLWQLVALGKVPWIAISLASLFGFYGLIRKQLNVDSLTGLTVETLLVMPLALGYWVWLEQQGISNFSSHSLYLIGAGLFTAVPLLLFASAARNLPLSTLGFLNYIAPTLQFLSAIFILNESFSVGRLISFSFIWIGLILFSLHLVKESSDSRKNARKAA